MKNTARGLAVVVLVVISGFCACMIAVMPSLTLSSVTGNRLEHQDILAAAHFADSYHRSNTDWPDNYLMAEHAGMPNVHLTPGSWQSFEDPCPSFAGAESDRFILSTWRGEYFDCLAYPSGRHTFGLSVWDYVFGGVGVLAAVLIATILTCRWAIRRHLSCKPGVRITT